MLGLYFTSQQIYFKIFTENDKKQHAHTTVGMLLRIKENILNNDGAYKEGNFEYIESETRKVITPEKQTIRDVIKTRIHARRKKIQPILLKKFKKAKKKKKKKDLQPAKKDNFHVINVRQAVRENIYKKIKKIKIARGDKRKKIESSINPEFEPTPKKLKEILREDGVTNLNPDKNKDKKRNKRGNIKTEPLKNKCLRRRFAT